MRVTAAQPGAWDQLRCFVLPGRRPMTLIRARGRISSHPRSASSLHSGYTGPTMAAYGGCGGAPRRTEGNPPHNVPPEASGTATGHPQWGKVSTGRPQATCIRVLAPAMSMDAMPCHAVCGLAHPGERVSVRARVDRHGSTDGYKTAPFPRRSPSEPDCLT
jgi:hypothetical protein